MKTNTRHLIYLLLFCIVMTLAACNSKIPSLEMKPGAKHYSINHTIIEKPSGRRNARSQSINLAFTSPPVSLNPYRTSSDVEQFLGKALFSTILVRQPWSEFPRNNLVKEWSTSSDGRTYSFVLEDGLRFSDGTSMTSRDIIASLKLLNGPLRNSHKYRMFTGDSDSISMTYIDDKQFTIRVSKPVPSLLYALADYAIIPLHIAEAVLDNSTDFNNLWKIPADSIFGSGPYIIDQVSLSEIILTPNRHYFKKTPDGIPLPFTPVISIRYEDELNKQILAFADKKIDILEITPSIDELLSRISSGSLGAAHHIVDTGYSRERIVFLYNSYSDKPGIMSNPDTRRQIASILEHEFSRDLITSSNLYNPDSQGSKLSKSLDDKNLDFRIEDQSGNTLFISIIADSENREITEISRRVVAILNENTIDCRLTEVPSYQVMDYIMGKKHFDIVITPVLIDITPAGSNSFLNIEQTHFTGKDVDLYLANLDTLFPGLPLLSSAIGKEISGRIYNDMNQFYPVIYKKTHWMIRNDIHNFHNNMTIEGGFSLMTIEQMFKE
jgi:MarR-like DNA-binding transcriptional regulator SgrR of sgrS sRNA